MSRRGNSQSSNRRTGLLEEVQQPRKADAAEIERPLTVSFSVYKGLNSDMRRRCAGNGRSFQGERMHSLDLWHLPCTDLENGRNCTGKLFIFWICGTDIVPIGKMAQTAQESHTFTEAVALVLLREGKRQRLHRKVIHLLNLWHLLFQKGKWQRPPRKIVHLLNPWHLYCSERDNGRDCTGNLFTYWICGTHIVPKGNIETTSIKTSTSTVRALALEVPHLTNTTHSVTCRKEVWRLRLIAMLIDSAGQVSGYKVVICRQCLSRKEGMGLNITSTFLTPARSRQSGTEISTAERERE